MVVSSKECVIDLNLTCESRNCMKQSNCKSELNGGENSDINKINFVTKTRLK